ncbi:hypothetical protein CDAR_316121, partial [Caerostris darwini]
MLKKKCDANHCIEKGQEFQIKLRYPPLSEKTYLLQLPDARPPGLLKFSDKPKLPNCVQIRAHNATCFALTYLTGYRDCYFRTKGCLSCMLFG